MLLGSLTFLVAPLSFPTSVINSRGLDLKRNGQICYDTCSLRDNDDPIFDDPILILNDGECDDGGSGSAFSICPLGTDCGDCGYRPVSIDSPLLPSPSPSIDMGLPIF